MSKKILRRSDRKETGHKFMTLSSVAGSLFHVNYEG